MEHIVAIMKQSKYCEQYIKCECYQSVWGGSPQWKMCKWNDQQLSGGGKCNCDKNDRTWREDSRYLTDKSTLPVTELRFGDTGDSFESEYRTLGKLRSWG